MRNKWNNDQTPHLAIGLHSIFLIEMSALKILMHSSRYNFFSCFVIQKDSVAIIFIKSLLLSHHQQHVCRDEWEAWERAPDSAEYNWHL